MATSTLTSKGQITVPVRVREQMGLRVGDRLRFEVDDNGRLVAELEEPRPLGSISGLLSHLSGSSPVSVEEMRQGLRRRALGRRALEKRVSVEAP